MIRPEAQSAREAWIPNGPSVKASQLGKTETFWFQLSCKQISCCSPSILPAVLNMVDKHFYLYFNLSLPSDLNEFWLRDVHSTPRGGELNLGRATQQHAASASSPTTFPGVSDFQLWGTVEWRQVPETPSTAASLHPAGP